MIFYFTGTGNSMWAAEHIGKILQQPAKNIASFMETNNISLDDEIAGFVFPTYMDDIPWLAKEFLLKLHLTANTYCFAIMTSNNGKSGKAFDNIDKALHLSGAKLSSVFDVQMPGNCIESSEKENAERLNLSSGRIEKIATQIKSKTINYRSKEAAVPRNFIEGSYFYGCHSLKRLTFINNFCVKDSCTGCGICAKICPVNNITIQNKLAVHGKQCAACYACVHWCPVHATLPAFPLLKHRKQYTHPEISLEQIIKSKG